MRSINYFSSLILLFFMASAIAQQLDPINNMCFRFDHQSTVKNKTLYIDGGKESFIDVDRNGSQVSNITIGYNAYMIAIDLSKSWDWKTNISEKPFYKRAQPKTGIYPPILSRGALYQGMNDDENLYLWGGTTSYTNTSFPDFRAPGPAKYSLWSYDVVSNEWDHIDVSKGSANRPSSASSAEAPDQGLAFFFNGELDSGSSLETQVLGDANKVFLEGMIVLDTKNHTTRNISTSAVSGDMPRSRGRMQYVPGIGEKGILLQIGGNQKPVNETDNTYIGNLVPMDEIDIFDVASLYNESTPNGTWYKQNASGDIPPGRVDSCLAPASASDNSSHNIYMYGGRGANSAYFDDIHILSIPSFTWTRVYNGSAPRFSHTCHRVGSRTMLSVGGTRTYKYTEAPCDFESKGINVLDMSSITWGSAYNATTDPYTVPAAVVAHIGGTETGNATQRSPAAGFSSPGLAALFNMPFPSRPHSSKPRLAVILGSSIAGSITVLGLSATVFYFYRNWFRRFVTGFPDSHMEIDSREKVVNELMDREIFHELNAENKYHSTTVKLGELSAGSVRTSAVADMLKRSSSPGELSADSMGGSTLGNTPASTPGETCPDSEGLKWPEKHSNKEGAWF